jgi:hypothetical protein
VGESIALGGQVNRSGPAHQAIDLVLAKADPAANSVAEPFGRDYL